MNKILDLIMVSTKLSRAEGEKLAQEIENTFTAQDGEMDKQEILKIYSWWHAKPEHPAMIRRWERDAISLYEDWQDALTAQEGEILLPEHTAQKAYESYQKAMFPEVVDMLPFMRWYVEFHKVEYIRGGVYGVDLLDKGGEE